MLELLRKKKADNGDNQTPLERLKAAFGSLNKLPTLPDAAVRALAIANNPASSMRDFAAVIETDPALAAGILRLVNCPLYRGTKTIESLDQAVVRVGLRECKNLIVAVSMRSIFQKTTGKQKAHCEILWLHSSVTATLCREINKALRLGHQGVEFACGLSHDIGRILIALGAPDLFPQVDQLDFVEDGDVLAREEEILGTDHCFVGAWFADHSQLPGSVISAIQYHHTPQEAPEHQPLIALVAMADSLANFLHREESAESYDLTTNPGWKLLAPGVAANLQQSFAASLPAILKKANEEAQSLV
jgi:HD-like signal output (HDOD) protein